MSRSPPPSLLPLAALPPQVAVGRSGLELRTRMRLATDGLADIDPVLSARVRPTAPWTRRSGVVAALVLAVALVLAPQATGATLVGAAVALYAAVTAHRLLLIRRAVANDPTVVVSDADARAIRDDDLPVYTVLVPAYQEPAVVRRLIDGLARLEYPADRLDI